MDIIWHNSVTGRESCPVCADGAAKRHVLDAMPTGAPGAALSLRQCQACGCGYFADVLPPAYEAEPDDTTALDFYLEQGAGVDVMAAPLAAIDPSTVNRYLEVGCGFGFSLDFARAAYGWQVSGIDPGRNARAGRDLLGLDIRSEYLTGDLPETERPDLILCSEVLEHTERPDAFIGVLRKALSSDGVLLLTTPNMEAACTGTPPGVLLPLLSPGHHLILYSPRGLEMLLRRGGFESVAIETRGATLVACAAGPGRTPDLRRGFDRGLYRSYLARRCADIDGATPLGIGLRARHVKELVNVGAFEPAAAAAADLRTAWVRGWASDPAAPAAVMAEEAPPEDLAAYHRRAPFCAASALYHLGMLAWQHAGDLVAARSCFEAAARTGERLRLLLRRIGSDDGETDHLVWRARSNLVRLAAWTAPDTAPALAEAFAGACGPLLKEPVPAALVHETLSEVFVTLVNKGRYEPAERLWARVPVVPEDRSGPTDASVSFVRGILCLNARHTPSDAAGHFACAHRISRRLVEGGGGTDTPLIWEALYHQALAWVVAGDAKQASSAMADLMSLPGRNGLPPLGQSEETRARALARTHNLL